MIHAQAKKVYYKNFRDATEWQKVKCTGLVKLVPLHLQVS